MSDWQLDPDYNAIWRCFDHVPVESTPAAAVMQLVEPASGGAWPPVLANLWEHDQFSMLVLMAAVIADGIQEPIIVGNDGELWDGHHRLAVALALGIDVPTRVIPQGGPILSHDFLPVAGHPDDDECTYRRDGTDATHCGEPRREHTA
ncbi:ParB-like nuclease family protein [Mycobacterium sp. BK086]|uniref:ParB N-terminal domain-containing protein n=1 Tax=Mycobacterium sp. BK086 TaxID=2512165 RepID=UPI00105C48D5|nr:ParB N-terminal domain-containing protein [Mycobacterium sp. BK086]TDO18158.1 ParB-like nuclease family protein [Mycobacterium sp. BK086]